MLLTIFDLDGSVAEMLNFCNYKDCNPLGPNNALLVNGLMLGENYLRVLKTCRLSSP